MHTTEQAIEVIRANANDFIAFFNQCVCESKHNDEIARKLIETEMRKLFPAACTITICVVIGLMAIQHDQELLVMQHPQGDA